VRKCGGGEGGVGRSVYCRVGGKSPSGGGILPCFQGASSISTSREGKGVER
jgi:hypothetical protein